MPNMKVGFLPDKGLYAEDQMSSLRVFIERHVTDMIVTDTDKADLIFAHHNQADNTDKLKIIVERADSSTLVFTRRWLKDDSVLCILKHTLAPYQLQNLPFCHRRYHITVLDGVYDMGHARQPLELISSKEFNKVKCRMPIFMRYHREKAPGLNRFIKPLNLKRDINIICKGSLQDDISHIGRHRGEVIGKFGGQPNQLFDLAEWHHALSRSKICICPWGYGEMCYRDYEAMLSGCVIVKPYTDFVETWPRIYRAGLTYVVCKTDFSDINEICQQILDNYDDYTDMINSNRERLINPDFDKMGVDFINAVNIKIFI